MIYHKTTHRTPLFLLSLSLFTFSSIQSITLVDQADLSERFERYARWMQAETDPRERKEFAKKVKDAGDRLAELTKGNMKYPDIMARAEAILTAKAA